MSYKLLSESRIIVENAFKQLYRWIEIIDARYKETGGIRSVPVKEIEKLIGYKGASLKDDKDWKDAYTQWLKDHTTNEAKLQVGDHVEARIAITDPEAGPSEDDIDWYEGVIQVLDGDSALVEFEGLPDLKRVKLSILRKLT